MVGLLIVFENNTIIFCIVFQSLSKMIVSFSEKKRTSLKTAHLFWTLRKRKNYCIENDLFKKNNLWPFFIQLKKLPLLKKQSILKKIYWQFFLTIVKEEFLLTKLRTL